MAHSQWLAWANLILETKLDRIDAELGSHPISRALHGRSERDVPNTAHAARGHKIRIDGVHLIITMQRAAPHIDAEEADVVFESVGSVVDYMVELGKRQRAIALGSHSASRVLDVAALDRAHALGIRQLDLDGPTSFLREHDGDEHEVRAPP